MTKEHWIPVAMVLTVAGGCGAIDETDGHVRIDRFRELVIVEDAIMSAPEGRNAGGGACSFPQLMTNAVGDGASEAVTAWLSTWNPAGEDDRGVAQQVLCPWLRGTATNQCDATCGECAARYLAPALAPFRLIAVVYRPDMALRTDGVAAPEEGRFIFALTAGPGDDAGNTELPFTVALEYALPARAPSESWAQRWHALGSVPDAGYPAALAKVTREFTGHDAAPVLRVRVRDDFFANGALREWQLKDGTLLRRDLPNTPDMRKVTAADVANYVAAHRSEIMAHEHVLPTSWTAVEAFRDDTVPAFTDNTRLNRAFALSTCQGCHADDQTIDGFHIAPGRRGRARVSPFLNDPSTPNRDELTRREDAFRILLDRAR